MFLGCRKTYVEPPPCQYFETNYDAPDSLKQWFSSIMDTSVTSINFQGKSNSGLSETVNISKDNVGYLTSICYTKYFWQGVLEYKSTLYNYNTLKIGVGIKTDFYMFGFSDPGYEIFPNTFDFKIHYYFYSDSMRRGYEVDLIQPIAPVYSTKIQAIYHPSAVYPPVISYLDCDTCYEYKGKYTQNNRTYLEVSRYKSPIRLGFSKTLKELLIDKKYGIIQTVFNDNTVWTIDPF